MIFLPLTDAALLAECEIQTFRSGGKGGQNVNKVETGVRLLHRPSGLVAQSTVERSQYLNKKRCIKKLRLRAAELNYRAPERIQTQPSIASRRRGQEGKRRHAAKKSLRRRPDWSGDE